MGLCASNYNIVHKHPFLLWTIKSGHITLSVFFTGASLSGCVTVGQGGCWGMLQGKSLGPLFLSGGGCTKSLSSLLDSVWIFKGCEVFFLAATFTCKHNFFHLLSLCSMVWMLTSCVNVYFTNPWRCVPCRSSTQPMLFPDRTIGL
jgi:hypothetical protein